MKRMPGELLSYELPLTDKEFLESFNRNMPQGYPLVSLEILKKFKEAHLKMFGTDGSWSLDHHRKRVIEWLPQNI